ncbi:MAG: hypothetical protein GY714_19230 [Desulfobacterales bacterium]|nr:hypothetical protein [Desulfobacterales bacterium]MCP4159757.1 hypothetical protein [Deltaproteobacteria bacterium]
MHTKEAYPCSRAEINNVIVEAKNIGLDGICITDHNFLWSEKDIKKLRDKHKGISNNLSFGEILCYFQK